MRLGSLMARWRERMRASGLRTSTSRNARSRRFCQLFAWRAFTWVLVLVVVRIVVVSRIIASVGLYHLVEGVLRFIIITSSVGTSGS